MIVQILSIFFALCIFVQTIYLFTCGQNYMRKAARRDNILYFLYKSLFVIKAGLIFGYAILTEERSFIMFLLILDIFIINQGKVNSARKLLKKRNARFL